MQRRHFHLPHPTLYQCAVGGAVVVGVPTVYCNTKRLVQRLIAKQREQSEKGEAQPPDADLCSWAWDQILHQYYGFKLLWQNTWVWMRLRKKIRRGEKLTRRERQLMERTATDLLRLLPFSLFIIIPGAELLLPVALALFPDLMPSTFVSTKEERLKHITGSLERCSVNRKMFEHVTSRIVMKENFRVERATTLLFRAVHNEQVVNPEMIRSVAMHFRKGGPLSFSNLPGYVVKYLSKYTGTYKGWKYWMKPAAVKERIMRKDVHEFLVKREKDDRCLAEAVGCVRLGSGDWDMSKIDFARMSEKELQQECVVRFMRWYGPRHALERQLKDWLELSLDKDVTNHTLLFLKPCATPLNEMTSHLSKSEMDHILGLNKFTDTMLQNTLRNMTEQAEKHSSVELSEEDTTDVDQLATHLKEVVEDEEETKKSVCEALTFLREVTHKISDTALLSVFDDVITTDPKTDSHGSKAATIGGLANGIGELLKKEHAVPDKPLPQDIIESPGRIMQGLEEFDLNENKIITRDEFVSFLARVRDTEDETKA